MKNSPKAKSAPAKEEAVEKKLAAKKEAAPKGAYKLDYADAPAIMSLAASPDDRKKGINPGDAIAWAIQHQDQLSGIIGFLKNLFKHHQSPNTPPPAPPVIPPIAPVPAPPAPSPSPVGGVKVVELRKAEHDGVFFIEEWDGAPGTGRVVDQNRMQEILGGGQVVRGAGINYNFSPFDEKHKEIGPGDPRHAQINGGQPYVEYTIFVGEASSGWVSGFCAFEGIELHQWDQNWGCTPRIKVPADQTNSRHRPMQLSARIIGTDVESGKTAVVFIP